WGAALVVTAGLGENEARRTRLGAGQWAHAHAGRAGQIQIQLGDRPFGLGYSVFTTNRARVVPKVTEHEPHASDGAVRILLHVVTRLIECGVRDAQGDVGLDGNSSPRLCRVGVTRVGRSHVNWLGHADHGSL